MRTDGVVADAGDLGPGDHACWGVFGDDETVRVLARYVTAGLERDERVVCVTGSRNLLGDLAATGVPAGEAERAGQLRVRPAAALFDADGRVHAAALEHLRTSVDRALQDGHTGLRFASDGVPVATRVRPDFVRFELDRERLISASPMTSLCMYDVGESDEQDAALISAVHGLYAGRAPAPTFRVRWVSECTRAVEGEIDLSTGGAWRSVLAGLTAPGRELVLDLERLEFLHMGGVRALTLAVDEMAAAGMEVTLRRPRPVLRRIVQALAIRTLGDRAVD